MILVTMVISAKERNFVKTCNARHLNGILTRFTPSCSSPEMLWEAEKSGTCGQGMATRCASTLRQRRMIFINQSDFIHVIIREEINIGCCLRTEKFAEMMPVWILLAEI